MMVVHGFWPFYQIKQFFFFLSFHCVVYYIDNINLA